MAIIFPTEGRSRELDLIKSGGTPSHQVALIQSNTVPDITTTWAGVTESTFSAYTRGGPTFGAITINGDDNAEMTSQLMMWTAPLIGSQNVYCWAWISTISGTVRIHRIERFASAPIVFTSGADPILVRIRPQHGACPEL